MNTVITWLLDCCTKLWTFMIGNSLLKYSIGLFLLGRIIYPSLKKYIKG